MDILPAVLHTLPLLLLVSAAEPAPVLTWVPFDISIVPPVNIFHPERKLIGGFSLNLGAGATAALVGVEVGLVYNRVDEWLVGLRGAAVMNGGAGTRYGIEAAFVGNLGGHASGVAVAGLFNHYDGAGGGIYVAGLWNTGGSVYGIQVSLFQNAIRDEGVALQVGVLNFAQGALIDFDVISSLAEGNLPDARPDYGLAGIQLGLIANGARNFSGIRIAPLNASVLRMSGLEFGLFNWNGRGALLASGEIPASGGLMVGAVNASASFSGVQIGLVNMTRRLRGLQLGLVNLNWEGLVPILPLLNLGW